MTLPTFTTATSADDVSLIIKPGEPDVLVLRTTNIPQVHARLTELRNRDDHPAGGRPREVWIDLSQCHSFREMRGEVLVRALRITQYLPAGFIGSCDKVKEIAQSASLPCIDTISQLPNISSGAVARVRVVPSAAVIELEQQKDIAKDLSRRLETAVSDHAELRTRYDLISEALCTVRVQRDTFEKECLSLRAQVSEVLGKLEWSEVQVESAETAIRQALDRLVVVEREKAQAQEQAKRLEDHGAMIEQSLAQASTDVESLRKRVLELEASEEAQLSVVHELRSRVRDFDNRMVVLNEEIQAREYALRSQVSSLEERNSSLQAEIEALGGTLNAVRVSLENERAGAGELVNSRDDVMRQSDLSNKMLEDALIRIEELTSQSEGLYASLETQRSQWESLSIEHDETRARLAQAKQDLGDATQSLIEAGERARGNRQEIERLSLIKNTSPQNRESLEVASSRQSEIELILCSAQERVELAEQVAATLRQEIVESQAIATEFNEKLNKAQADLDVACAARDTLVQETLLLRATITEGVAIASEQQKKIDRVQTDKDALQNTLMNASLELVKVQQNLDEQLRVNRVLSDLVDRQSSDLSAACNKNSMLTGTLEGVHTALAAESEAHVATRDTLEQARLALGSERTLHAATREALDNTGSKLLMIEASRAKSASDIIVVKELLVSEKSNHASTRLTLDQTRAVLEKLQDGFNAQVIEKDQLRLDFEHKLVASLAENDSLNSRLETSQREFAAQVLRLEETLADVRIQSETLTHSCEQLSARLEEPTQEHALNQQEIVKLNSIVDQSQVDLRETRAQVRDREEVIIEQESRIGELEIDRDNLAAAEDCARTERKSRAALEIQLVDAQNELAVVRRQVELERSSGVVQRTALHGIRVRSGQQLASRGDLVVTQPVSSGAELVAEGSVHIYAAMQGRVHAGSAGDLDARIYCMNFAAEAVTIAGNFVVFETVPHELWGRPVEIWFDRERDCMCIEPLSLS